MRVYWYTLYAFVVGRSEEEALTARPYWFYSYVVLPRPSPEQDDGRLMKRQSVVGVVRDRIKELRANRDAALARAEEAERLAAALTEPLPSSTSANNLVGEERLVWLLRIIDEVLNPATVHAHAEGAKEERERAAKTCDKLAQNVDRAMVCRLVAEELAAAIRGGQDA